MAAALAAEWLKLRSVRSTWVTVAVVGVVVLVTALATWNGVNAWENATTAEGRLRWETARPMERITFPFTQFCVGVLGVLAFTSEYGTGMIRSTFAAVPRRGTVLTAKVGAVGGATFVTGLAGVTAMHLTGRWIVGDRPFDAYADPVAEAVGPLLAMGLSVAVVALVGMGVGAVLRSTAGTLVTLAVLVFVLPTIAGFLPDPWNERIGAVLPAQLSAQVAGSTDPVLPPLVALTVLAGYAATALGAAAVAISRRDP
ncbi:ABC transporter permease [Halostreptopolyspora alba]|uniref:ABC transporter permease n=1 Tax=Halostreptopolyspora alba TaxID=2487137 RepID=A0A3N0EDV5_9ACTN|nr:ABC transporter permease [Nocardiopsaceae bacterium YIM 96095]